MRATPVALVLLTICMSCAAPRYQLPQSEAELQASVATTEGAYMLLYGAHKSGEVSKPAMANIDTIYESWRRAQQWIVDALRAGALELAKGD